jgi:hypothetical protein
MSYRFYNQFYGPDVVLQDLLPVPQIHIYLIELMLVLQEILPFLSDSTIYLIVLMLILQDIPPVLQILLSI